MLVLSRHKDEEIVIGQGPDLIRVLVVQIRGDKKVRLGIEAPDHIPVHRREVWEAIERERSRSRPPSRGEPPEAKSA
jgi:carbon storage regulator